MLTRYQSTWLGHFGTLSLEKEISDGALVSTLVISRLLLLSSPAQLARLGKLGMAQERLSDLPLVVDSLRCDTFNDGTGCLAAPTLEVLLGKPFSHFRHGGGIRTPFAHDSVSILHHTGLP
jgi:hypothetical protein